MGTPWHAEPDVGSTCADDAEEEEDEEEVGDEESSEDDDEEEEGCSGVASVTKVRPKKVRVHVSKKDRLARHSSSMPLPFALPPVLPLAWVLPLVWARVEAADADASRDANSCSICCGTRRPAA